MDQPNNYTIRERFQWVLDQIAATAIHCGRDAKTVKLVVVSKSQSLEVIRTAIEAGITILGENYMVEAVTKISALQETGVEWHMIGHVQSRKADLVAGYFTMLHSLDSIKLAKRLEQYCGDADRVLPVLLEVNISGEESKFGFSAWDERAWSDLEQGFEQIIAFPHLQVLGFMVMPPFFSDPEKTRPFFSKTRRLQEYIRKRIAHSDWKELSMGTSVDFKVAIEEGATYVRVGQAILGPRKE